MPLVGNSFHPFGAAHWTMLVLTAVGGVAVVWLGRRLRGTSGEQIFCRVFGWVLLSAAVVDQVHSLVPADFVLSASLPLQLSDVLRLVSAYALLSRRLWAVSLTYYWGLTLDVQSLATPDLQYTYSPVYDFSMYWGLHIMVFWAVLLLTWGVGIRPTWRSYWTAMVATFIWAAVAFSFNIIFGTDYGYLNRKPASASLFDVMGAWPLYLLVSFVAMVLIWALITVPWTVGRRAEAIPAASG